MSENEPERKITNSKPIPHIPLPFKEVMKDVLKVKPEKLKTEKEKVKSSQLPKIP